MREALFSRSEPRKENMDSCLDYSLLLPCTCKERGSGLDITCENVHLEELQVVTKNMKNHTSKMYTVRGLESANNYQCGGGELLIWVMAYARGEN